MMFTLAELEKIIPLVRASVPPTPQYAWPLLKAMTGVDVVVKHENHTPIGTFKVRGGIVYFDRLKRERSQVKGIVTATRGNHGQSLTFADGMAVRVPDATALEVIQKGAERIVEVTDDEIAGAIRAIYSATHNCAEGAGAAALAALIKERAQLRGRRAAVILTGQNIDRRWMQTVLAGGTPRIV